MAGGAAEIHQPALRQDDQFLAVGELDLVDLRLDLVPFHVRQGLDSDLRVEMADIADDGAVAHCAHMVEGDHVDIAGGGHEDIADGRGVVHGHDFVAFHRRLERADGVDLGHQDPGAGVAQRRRRALADISVAGDHRDLAGEHDIGRAPDAVDEAFAATVEIVELRLGDRVVHVERRRRERARALHCVETVDPRGGLLRQTADIAHERRIFLVHDGGQIAAVVEDHVGAPALRPFDGAVDAAPELLVGLALPGEYGESRGGDGGGRMVLGGEHVAARPAQVRAECTQRFHQHGGLNRHVQTAGDPRPGERAGASIFLAQRHQAGHFGFGDGDFLAPPVGERDVGDLVVVRGGHAEPPALAGAMAMRGTAPYVVRRAAPRKPLSPRRSGLRQGPPEPPAPLPRRPPGRRVQCRCPAPRRASSGP